MSDTPKADKAADGGLRLTACSACAGTGQQKGSNEHEWETYMEPCGECEGSGEVPSLAVTPIEPTEPCRNCDGNGRIYVAPLTYQRCSCDSLPNSVLSGPTGEDNSRA